MDTVMDSVMESVMDSVTGSVMGSVTNHAISLINAFTTEKHMVQDDILFANPLPKKGKMSQHV